MMCPYVDGQRSSLISAIRAHFAEFGTVAYARIRNIERLLTLLEDGDTMLPELARRMLQVLSDQLRDVAMRVAQVEAELLAWHRENETSRRLAAIPGVGPITASAIVATVGDASQFKSGRQFSAWLFRSSDRAEARNVSAGSQSVAMAICAVSSFTARGPSLAGAGGGRFPGTAG